MIDFVSKSLDKIEKLSTIELVDYYIYLYNLDDTKFTVQYVDILCSLLVYIGNLLEDRPVPEEYIELADSEGYINVEGAPVHWTTYRLFNINPTNIS